MDDTWVVVADGAQARFYKTDAEMQALERVHDLKNKHHAPEHRRRPDGHVTGHHAEEDKFAHQIAGELGEFASQNRYRDLVLVAPPHFLGVLRGALAGPAGGKVTASVPKDFGKLADHELAGKVRAHLSGQHIEDAR